MKKVWVKVDPWDKGLVLTALEGGADGLLLPRGGASQVKRLGRITTIAPDGDIIWGKEAVSWQVKEQEDIEKATEVPSEVILVIDPGRWKVVPWENLVAKRSRIYALVRRYEEVKAALGALEKGVEGVVVDTHDSVEVKKIINLVKREEEVLHLEAAEVLGIKPLGLGDRVCIDTCTKMKKGEGMLVGSSSAGFFLIHAENIPNPYVEPRPFRVNAGAIHSYIRVPDGKTRYLSELRWGQELLIVNVQGRTQISYVGRVKIERRPLMLVEAKIKESKIACILQNAETVRLMTPSGEPISLIDLKEGDEVLVLSEEMEGRHLGHLVQERIEEG
ncbi:MAG: 3-dehydroquinate synthase II [Deltaproteobacteria bacterium]|nr:MAG: 3-dehydroquinate synthase II [Deltaproteobacteria bacterium]